MLKNQRLTLALLLALGSGPALALGLGTIDVRTRLNEPLVAEIPILGSTPQELKALKVRLASPDAFQRAGLDRPAAMSANLEFSIIKGKDGRDVVRVTTSDKVKDPFVSFLLEVEWERGRLLREYTVLLDPPVTAAMRAAPRVAPATSQPAPAAPPPPPPEELVAPPPMPQPAPVQEPAQPTPAPAQPQPTQAAPAPAPAPTPTPAPTSPTPAASRQDNYGPVRDGETLWSIAEFARPDQSVSMDQVMLALQQANPDAFIGGNINRLKKGAVLRLPSTDEIRSVDRGAAASMVIEQMREWRATAGTVQPEVDSSTQASSPSTPKDSRLELVPPRGESSTAAQSGASASGDGKELRSDLARAKEQVSALSQENRELKSRVSDLEQIDSDYKKLVELKNSELAAAQARVRELEAQLESAPQTAAMPSEPEAAPEESTTEAVAEMPAETPAEDATSTEESAPEDALVDVTDLLDDAEGEADESSEAGNEEASSETQPIAEAPAAEAEPMAEDVPADAEAKPWYSNPLILGGGAGLLVLAGLGVLFGRGSKKPKPVKSSGRPSVADNYAAATAAAASAAAQQDDDGQDDQAQTLVDAIAEQPDDLGRHLALVRHYYEAGDESGFEGAAEAMYAQLFDPEDMSWKQVLAMGREMLPDHPLFAAPADHDHGGEDLDSYGGASQAPEEVDWGSPSDSAHYEESAAEDVNSTQQFSVDDVSRMAEQQRARFDVADESPAEDDMSLDMDLSGSDASAEPLEAPASYDLDMDGAGSAGDSELELGDTDLGGVDADDAAATKLELARAYLDMGDVEGARGMLEEVVNEGNAGQRAEAKRLLDEVR